MPTHIQTLKASNSLPLLPPPPPVSPDHLDEAESSWDGPSALTASSANGSPGSSDGGPGPRAQPEWVDCIQASDMCNQNPSCSSRYRVMRQCLVGKEKEAMLDNNRECQAALEVLLLSPLYDCRCKRGMKKELQCLQNYWAIHMGLTEGKRRDNPPSHKTSWREHLVAPDAAAKSRHLLKFLKIETRPCEFCTFFFLL